jgi:hypothetical protein
MAFPRAVLEEVGGFDTRLGYRGRRLLPMDDNLLQMRLAEAGYGRYYDPRLTVRHSVLPDRISKRYFLRRFYWEGVAAGLLAVDEHRFSRAESVQEGLRQGARILREPRQLVELARNGDDDPVRFRERCLTAYRLGRAFQLVGVART